MNNRVRRTARLGIDSRKLSKMKPGEARLIGLYKPDASDPNATFCDVSTYHGKDESGKPIVSRRREPLLVETDGSDPRATCWTIEIRCEDVNGRPIWYQVGEASYDSEAEAEHAARVAVAHFQRILF